MELLVSYSFSAEVLVRALSWTLLHSIWQGLILAAVAGTNALIVSDRATNIYQLENIIRNLDGTGQNDIEAISLQSSQAEEVIGLLETMSAPLETPPRAWGRHQYIVKEPKQQHHI